MTPNTPAGEELKACRFCQSEALDVAFIPVSSDIQWSQVKCRNCGAHGPCRAFRADAIANWNGPAPDPAPQQGNERLIEELWPKLRAYVTPPPFYHNEKGWRTIVGMVLAHIESKRPQP